MRKRMISIVMAMVIILCTMPNVALATEQEESVKRYTVLVLDASGATSFVGSNDNRYTTDSVISYVKEASNQFLKSISNASGDNYVAIVSYKDSATVVSGFTDDMELLKERVYDISESGSTRSIAAGLELANSLLDNINGNNAIKNVVLFTSGVTNAGEYSYSGVYDENTTGSRWKRTDNKVNLYAYANSACAQATVLKDNNTNVYTIGLFQEMVNIPEIYYDVVDFFKLTAKDIASSDEYYYSVDEPDDLEFIFGEVADDIANIVKKIMFTYQSGDDHTATCYYTNDYFSKSSYEYNPSLATMSLSFAMSAFGSSKGGTNYSNKSVNAKNLLKEIGIPMENIKTNYWFTQEPTTDSIGVIAGNMPIAANGKKYTLIAIAIRGGGYEREWASNFTMGREGNHTGFETAKKNVVNFLKDYISEQNINGDVKFWITGYSRAAATANLLAGEIDNDIVLDANITYSYGDVYAYCFETPAGVIEAQVSNSDKYNNIFNIINPNDPVTYLAPVSLGFARYGVDKHLPTPETTANYAKLKNKMLSVYNSLSSTDRYIVDDFSMKKLDLTKLLTGGGIASIIQDDGKNDYSQSYFLTSYVRVIAKDFIKNRSNYVLHYQDEIREICSVMFGCSTAQSEKVIESFVEQVKVEWGELLLLYAWNTGVIKVGSEERAFQMVSNWFKKALQEAGITLYDQDAIDSAGKKLSDLLLAVVVNHPNYAITAFMNAEGLMAGHYPELCYAWLASMDSYYSQDPDIVFNSGGYRIIRINCAVDVDVYDKDGKKVASIVNEQPVEISDSSHIYGIDEDGQKYVVLPVDMGYRLSVTAREDDFVNISISEYCASVGDYTRNVNYFDIKLDKGKTITGIIPAYNESEISIDTPNGSSADYILLDTDDNIINKNSDISGESSSDNTFNVSVTSDNTEQGMAIGSGSHMYGTFAKVEAIALEGYQFIGWYQGDTLLSTDEVFRIRVTENNELVAKFETEICLHAKTEIKNAQEATCGQEGYTGDEYCVDCEIQVMQGDKINATGEHKYGDWDIIKEPTASEKGVKVRKCAVCGYEENVQILVINEGSNDNQETKEENSPETGGGNDLKLWILLSNSSLLIILIIVNRINIVRKFNR